ncbi:MAG: tol-pal system YbgF family protein [bacterium]
MECKSAKAVGAKLLSSLQIWEERAMKALRFLFVVGLMALCVTNSMMAGDRSQNQKFQEAIHLMETKGDYPAAIRLFQEVAKGPDRNLAARSLLYVGICYEKLGKDEAKKAYRRIVQEFADQQEVVTQARARLAAYLPLLFPLAYFFIISLGNHLYL